jgi:Raf kinase inhibitor-like YbhB/YbcL family protein
MALRPILACLAMLVAAGLCACDRKSAGKQGDPDMTVQTQTITVRSDAFEADGKIPKKYTGEGENISPSLRWTEVPAAAKEFALIVDDPDAPGKNPFVHWVLYNVLPTVDSLKEGVEKTPEPSMPVGARQGRNSAGTIGYFGPMPPPGRVHHYHFHLYALDKAMDLKPEMQKEQVLDAMQGHILAEGELVGTYEKK